MTLPILSRRQALAIGAGCCFPQLVRGGDVTAAQITAIVFSPDGKQIITGSQAGVSARDRQGTILGTIQTELDNVHDLCFAPDGRSIAVAGGTPGETGVVEFFSWPSGELQRRVGTHDDVVYQVAFLADGSRWVAASGDEVCSVYEIGRDKPTSRFTKHSRAVLAVTCLPDGKTAVSASRDETLRVWDTNTGDSLRTLHNHSRDVHALALQKVGGSSLPTVASASADGTVRFWQPTIGRMVRFARLPSQPLSIAWAAGGTKLVAGCRDGKIRLIDPITVQTVDTIDVSDGWVYAIGVDPTDDRRIAISSNDSIQTRII